MQSGPAPSKPYTPRGEIDAGIDIGQRRLCGWPTAQHLSRLGPEIKIINNLSGRSINHELEAYLLSSIQPMGKWLRAKLPELGLKLITLEKGLIAEVINIAKRYTDRCDRSKILCMSRWTKDRTA